MVDAHNVRVVPQVVKRFNLAAHRVQVLRGALVDVGLLEHLYGAEPIVLVVACLYFCTVGACVQLTDGTVVLADALFQ